MNTFNPSTNNPTYLNRTVFDVEVVSEESWPPTGYGTISFYSTIKDSSANPYTFENDTVFEFGLGTDYYTNKWSDFSKFVEDQQDLNHKITFDLNGYNRLFVENFSGEEEVINLGSIQLDSYGSIYLYDDSGSSVNPYFGLNNSSELPILHHGSMMPILKKIQLNIDVYY